MTREGEKQDADGTGATDADDEEWGKGLTDGVDGESHGDIENRVNILDAGEKLDYPFSKGFFLVCLGPEGGGPPPRQGHGSPDVWGSRWPRWSRASCRIRGWFVAGDRGLSVRAGRLGREVGPRLSTRFWMPRGLDFALAMQGQQKG
jgi:hypothetical protein